MQNQFCEAPTGVERRKEKFRGIEVWKTIRAAGFFVLQYTRASDEGSLDEEKEKDFYEKANREGDDEGEKDRIGT